MKRLLVTSALAITLLAAGSASPAEARASNCNPLYGSNWAQVDCTNGNYGDPFWMTIPCRKDYWWGGSHSVTESGNLGRVGYGGAANVSTVICQSGYYRSGGGIIYTP